MSSAPTRTAGLRPRRYKATLACVTCRRRKLKCDGARPVCERCQKTKGPREECKYVTPSSQSRVQPPLTPNLPTPSASTFSLPEPSDVHEDAIHGSFNEVVGDDVNEFPSVVKSTINTRLGLPSCKKRCPIPLTDAPMFGSLSILQDLRDEFNQADDVLPPRKQADRLVYLYWHSLEPLEPLLDEKQFHRSYQTFFTGGELDGDARIFLATLNTIFALAIQLQESTPSQSRENSSRTFFLRAWRLLRPEAILWGAGSLELVQCLLLITRYLQCTRNLHQTWMALGSAVRLAQSLGLHASGDASSSFDQGVFGRDGPSRHRAWRCCVFLDRRLSWSLGRPPITLTAPFSNPSQHTEASRHDTQSPDFISYKMGEVDELTNYILSSQRSNSLTDSLGLPPLTPSSDSKVVSRLDARLTELKKELPLPILLNSSQNDAASGSLTLLHLRLSHARILLFRPMLARLCLSRSQTSDLDNGSLEDRMLQQCATLCIESARNMITLVHDSAMLDQHGIGVLPWWIRIFYCYIAIQHLIASMLRPDIFASTVPEAWGTAMTALGAHEPLSQSVTRCMASFRSMWQKVIDINCQETLGQCPPPKVENQVFQDIFEHLGFDIDLPTFDLDNAAWLGNVDWNI